MKIENDCLQILQDRRLIDSIKGKTFLITGSNGLIGNYFVTLLDVANREFDTRVKAYCISKHLSKWTNNTFHFITQDLSKPFQLNYEVDYIIHAACYSQPKLFTTNELETIALNISATQNLLELARDNGAKFLFLSSSEIYGNASKIPTPETYIGTFPTDNLRAAYVESKRMGEVLCFIHNRQFGNTARVARLSSVYGPGISIQDSRAMGDFMRQAFTNMLIQLLDKGQAQRTYCYITDAVTMLLDVLLRGKETVYNVGGIETCSLFHLGKLIAQEFGVTCLTGEGEGLKDAPTMVKLDISKIQSEFGIKSFVPLVEGICRTIQWNYEEIKIGGKTWEDKTH